MGTAAVKTENLGKRYKIYPQPMGRITEWMSRGRLVRHEEKWALRDVSFEIPRGSALGVIGSNGAGKSTLLKVVSGTTPATTGSFQVNGRLGSLLELGAGFHPDFTGRDNVFMNAAINGIPKREVQDRFQELAEFAELGEFMERPVRTYSSGMAMRLGFSVAIMSRPEVLILDEVLAVGDQHFQKKCMEVIREIRESGTTILFVSHSVYHVRQICDRAIWIKDGAVVESGDPTRVTDDYVNFFYAQAGRRAVEAAEKAEDRAREGAPHLCDVKMCREGTTEDLTDFDTGDVVDIHVSFNNPGGERALNVGIVVMRNDDVEIFTSRSNESGHQVTDEHGSLIMRVPLTITAGEYYVGGCLLDETGDRVLDERVAWHRFRMHYGGMEKGVYLPRASWLQPQEVS